MHISAKEMVHLMKQRLALLEQYVAEGNERGIYEQATALEAYCHLFKKASPSRVDEVPHVSMEIEEKKPASTPAQKQQSSLGNLLDF